DLLSSKTCRRRLIAERIDGLSNEQDVRGAVGVDTRARALGVCRAHLHPRMARVAAFAVGDRAGEGPRALSRRNDRCCEKNKKERSHMRKERATACTRPLLLA